jgi:6-phosphofructokinase
VQPLNAVLYAAQEACRKSGVELIGFRSGWQGVMESSYVDLLKKKIDPTIGGTMLRSSRVNVAANPGDAQIVLNNLERLGVSGLIVVGGEDTLSNALQLKEFPQSAGIQDDRQRCRDVQEKEYWKSFLGYRKLFHSRISYSRIQNLIFG